jgi:prolyl-tRNA synthetase
MRLDDFFGGTVKNPPTTSDPGTQIAIQGGYIRVLGDKVHLLPLGRFVLDRLLGIIEATFNPLGFVEFEPGAGSGRELIRFLSNEIKSYRQLPDSFVRRGWISSGLSGRGLSTAAMIRAVEFIEIAAELSEKDPSKVKFSTLIDSLCEACGLQLIQAADVGDRLVWIFPHEVGNFLLLRCSACEYHASTEGAQTCLSQVAAEIEELHELHTPGAHTMQALADSAQVNLDQTMKVVMLATEKNELIFALIRGDRDVNLSKISAYLGIEKLRTATETEIKLVGADPGYASPYGLTVRPQIDQKPGIIVLADDSIRDGENFVIGANREEYHLKGAKPDRDFDVTAYMDLNHVLAGDPCPLCHGTLLEAKGVKVAEWKPIADAFTFTDDGGNIRGGSAARGRVLLEPLLASAFCEYGSEGELQWPPQLAPFKVHIISIHADQEAKGLKADLAESGIKVLLDDRDASAGIKFSDADLVGCPFRITVSQRSLKAGGVEVFRRSDSEVRIIPLDDATTFMKNQT